MKGHYPFKEFRPYAAETLDAIDKAITLKKKFILVNALPGTGKSGLAVAFSRKYKTPILTATKILQEQYTNTEEFWKEYSVKGKANYMCGLPGQETTRVDEALCCSSAVLNDNQHLLPTETLIQITKNAQTQKDGSKKLGSAALKTYCSGKGICAYYTLRDHIGTIPGAVTNYDLFFNIAIRPKSGGKGLASTHISKSVVLDEAHQIVDKIQDYFGSSFTNQYAVKLLGKHAARVVNEDPILWIRRLAKLAAAEVEQESDPVVVTKIKRYIDKINITLAQELKDPTKFFLEDTGIAINFKPLDLRSYKNIVFGQFEHVLILSATLQPNFREILGITEEESVLISPPSIFPKKNRPIIFPRNIARLNKASVIEAGCEQAQFINLILGAHPTEKGILHCSSYRLFDQLRIAFKSEKRFIWVDRDTDKSYALQQHADSKKPTVLVSPAMTEGVDLCDDLARFQIMLKVPYPMLDDYTKKLMEIYPTWYDSATCTNIVQAYGRAVRSETDRAIFYILDGTFNIILGKSGHLLSPYFKEALQMGTKESLVQILEQKARTHESRLEEENRTNPPKSG